MARKRRDNSLTIRIPTEEKEKLRKEAEDRDISISDVVIWALREAIFKTKTT
jgi:predicted HicB family RNase H-like nuclease